MNLFTDFGLLPSLLDTLKQKKIFRPTEIQAMAIPMMMSGQSVVGVSETGSGKTLTYALPLLHMLKSLENEGSPVTEIASPRAVVILPTRDLGEQVSKVFKTLTHETRIRVRPALGGMEFEQARRNISGAFEILLATPGRLIQLMDKKLINLKDVQVLVFDEADQMLDQGFLPDSNRIVKSCPSDIQLALFSATVSPAVQELMNSLFVKAEVIRSSGSGKTVATLMTQNKLVKDGKRWPLFETLISKKVTGGTLVFTNTREQCDKLAHELTEKGYACAIYRGEMEKNDRRANLKKFREGTIDLLISTDLAARGLDLEHVGRVINYHLPQQMENYLHRVGRTARAGKSGLVINLVTERDARLMSKIDDKIASELNVDSETRPQGKPKSQQMGKLGLKNQASPRVKKTQSESKQKENKSFSTKKEKSPSRIASSKSRVQKSAKKKY